MFVRTATRRNKDGSAVRYVQLVQNERMGPGDEVLADAGSAHCSAPPTPGSPPPASPPATSSSWKSNAAGGTSSKSSTCAPSTTGWNSGSGPTSSCAGSPCSSSASPRPPPAPPGTRSPKSSASSPSAPSPAPCRHLPPDRRAHPRPARHLRQPPDPLPEEDHRSRPRHSRREGPDQRLVTRPAITAEPIPAGHTPESCTRPCSHLRNAGGSGAGVPPQSVDTLI